MNRNVCRIAHHVKQILSRIKRIILMAIPYNRVPVTPGVNMASRINQELEKIQEALSTALSREGGKPNAMQAVLDMGLHDIINVGKLKVDELYIDGEKVVPGEGLCPVVDDIERRLGVLEVVTGEIVTALEGVEVNIESLNTQVNTIQNVINNLKSMAFVDDAPFTGSTYGRKGGEWSVVGSGTGGEDTEWHQYIEFEQVSTWVGEDDGWYYTMIHAGMLVDPNTGQERMYGKISNGNIPHTFVAANWIYAERGSFGSGDYVYGSLVIGIDDLPSDYDPENPLLCVSGSNICREASARLSTNPDGSIFANIQANNFYPPVEVWTPVRITFDFEEEGGDTPVGRRNYINTVFYGKDSSVEDGKIYTYLYATPSGDPDGDGDIVGTNIPGDIMLVMFVIVQDEATEEIILSDSYLILEGIIPLGYTFDTPKVSIPSIGMNNSLNVMVQYEDAPEIGRVFGMEVYRIPGMPALNEVIEIQIDDLGG